MIIEFSNKKKRAFELVFLVNWDLFIYLLGIIFIGVIFRNSPKPIFPFLILFIVFYLLIFWFIFYQYIFNYFLANKDAKLIIDTEKMLIQIIDLEHKSDQSKCPIERLILHKHSKAKLAIENPKRIDDKLENWLQRDPTFKRINRLWYLEVISNSQSIGYITPLMTNLKDISFNNIEIVYEESPKIKLR